MSATRRRVEFTGPPAADVAERCLRSAELLTDMRRRLLDPYELGPERRRLDAELLRGVIVDLVLAATYLQGAS